MARQTSCLGIITGTSPYREHVFIYGTLKRGCRNHHPRAEALFVDECRAHGLRLYDLGPFPLAITEDAFLTQGEVYAITSQQLEALDRFEGVLRLEQHVQWILSDGQIAWIYVGRRQVIHVRPIGPHDRVGAGPVADFR